MAEPCTPVPGHPVVGVPSRDLNETPTLSLVVADRYTAATCRLLVYTAGMPERAASAAKVTRADRYRQAKALRDEGLLLREIAERTGSTIKMVSELLNDPDGSRGRARRRECAERKRKDCPTCGERMGAGTAWKDNQGCRACFHKRLAEGHEEMLAFVEWMWNEGCTLDEMAAELGWSSSPAALVDALRKAGRIGYRYKAYEQRVAA